MVKFKPVLRKNPKDLTLPAKYYAAAIGDGETDFNRLAELISYQCTLTPSDIVAVLMQLEHNVIDELNQGRIVKLGILGNFQVGISAIGKDTEAEVSANDITRNRILFKPSKQFKKMLSNVKYRKSS